MIVSNEYRKEVERLAADPTIRAMAMDVIRVPLAERESWTFVSAACDTAHEKGVKFHTIGAPAEAINGLLSGRFH